MTYVLRGLLAKDGYAESIATRFVATQPVPLNQGLRLIPLTDETLADLGLLAIVDRERVPEQLLNVLRDVSAEGVVAYVEAEFFGGEGAQTSVVFERSSLVLGPTIASTPFEVEEGAINQALRYLGITIDPDATDEFESVGLGRRRRTNDWLTATR